MNRREEVGEVGLENDSGALVRARVRDRGAPGDEPVARVVDRHEGEDPVEQLPLDSFQLVARSRDPTHASRGLRDLELDVAGAGALPGSQEPSEVARVVVAQECGEAVSVLEHGEGLRPLRPRRTGRRRRHTRPPEPGGPAGRIPPAGSTGEGVLCVGALRTVSPTREELGARSLIGESHVIESELADGVACPRAHPEIRVLHEPPKKTRTRSPRRDERKHVDRGPALPRVQAPQLLGEVRPDHAQDHGPRHFEFGELLVVREEVDDALPVLRRIGEERTQGEDQRGEVHETSPESRELLARQKADEVRKPRSDLVPPRSSWEVMDGHGVTPQTDRWLGRDPGDL